jgi:hypothetical protein
MRHGLSPRATIVGLSVLMPDDNDSNAGLKASIYNRVRKDPQRKHSAPLRGWRAEAWMLDQELSDALELGKKPLRHEQSRLLRVEVQGVGDILLGARVKGISHRTSLDRRRFIASGPETSATEPDSNRASLRSASRSHASSTSGSESRLAMSRSRRCDRSDDASFRASASRTSRLVLIVISDVNALQQPVACHNQR